MTAKQHALFVKLGAIGDVIMALPAARYLKSQGFHLTWMCGKSVAPLVQEFSGADEVFAVNDHHLLAGSTLQAIAEIAKVNWILFGKKFDAIFIGHSDPRYHYLVASARGPKRSFGTEIAGQWIPKPDRHHANEYLRLVNFSKNPLEPESFWPTPLQAWAGAKARKIGIAPGGAKNLLADDRLRRWPLKSYVLLAEKLAAAGFEIQLFGGPTDLGVVSEFSHIGVKSWVGELSLLDTLKALSRVEVLVAHDSGPLHLGGLAQVPVVGLFGPTRSAWRFPFLNRGAALEFDPPISCQPCYDGKNYAVCSLNRCLSEINVDQVFQKVLEITRNNLAEFGKEAGPR